MKLHTNLTYQQVHATLVRAQRAGRVAPDVFFVVDTEHNSRSHPRSFEIQLGTLSKDTLPAGYQDPYGKNQRVRRYKNSGQSGADSVWAAMWHEWGWWMAEVFKDDPYARFGALTSRHGNPFGYQNRDDFNRKTEYNFTLPTEPAPVPAPAPDVAATLGTWTNTLHP